MATQDDVRALLLEAVEQLVAVAPTFPGTVQADMVLKAAQAYRLIVDERTGSGHAF